MMILPVQAEADMAAALFWELRNFLKKAVQAGKRPNGVRVGVIAFYKAQVALLRETFQRLEVASGEPGLAHEVQSNLTLVRNRMDWIFISACLKKLRGNLDSYSACHRIVA